MERDYCSRESESLFQGPIFSALMTAIIFRACLVLYEAIAAIEQSLVQKLNTVDSMHESVVFHSW